MGPDQSTVEDNFDAEVARTDDATGTSIGRRSYLRLTAGVATALGTGATTSVSASDNAIGRIANEKQTGSVPSDGDATWAIDYDDYSSTDQVHEWDSDSADFVSSPSMRGNTSLEWRHRQETNHGNSIVRLGDFEDRLPELTSTGHAYECYYTTYIYMPSTMPTAGDGEYTMRFGFAGLSSGEAVSGSGSPPLDGTNGWYAAPMWTSHSGVNPSPDSLGYGLNFYDLNYGSSSNFYSDYEITPDDDWHKYDFYMNVNSWEGTSKDANGVVKLWHDDNLVLHEDDLVLTHSEDNMIEYIGSQWNLLRYNGSATSDFEWYWDAMDIYLGEDIPSDVRDGVERPWW